MAKTNAVEHKDTAARCVWHRRKFFFRFVLDALLMLSDALLAGVYAAKEEYDLTALWSFSFLLSTGMLGRDVWEYHNECKPSLGASDSDALDGDVSGIGVPNSES